MGVDYLYSFDGSAGVFICLFVEGYCHFITFVSLFHCPGSCCLFIFGGEGDSLFGAILIDRPVFVHHANSVTFAGKGQNLDTGCKVVHKAPRTSSYVNTRSISKSGGISITLTVEESFGSFDTTKTLWLSSVILESEDFLYE